MTPTSIFQYHEESPPTTAEFQSIGNFLVTEFSKLLLGPLEVLQISVEDRSWVYVDLFIGNRRGFEGTTYSVVITYSFRDQRPIASAVLLKFQDGERETKGIKTILTTQFTTNGWEELAWEDDEFGEWSCRHASELIALKN
ncbi:MAG: hypothetical protein J0M26_27610 [Planctomycetes bacterium]|nr:hypothetical protein [Planctomycetota bacterium]